MVLVWYLCWSFVYGISVVFVLDFCLWYLCGICVGVLFMVLVWYLCWRFVHGMCVVFVFDFCSWYLCDYCVRRLLIV